MTLDTAQPATAAETAAEPVSKEEQHLAAADAFKVALGQKGPPPLPERGEGGRFKAAGADEGDADEVIEAEAGGDGDNADPPDAAESHEDGEDGDEAAEEAQRKDPSMPESWPADQAELWNSLEPSAQDVIRQRDAQMLSAVNVKFMEAANLRKAHEGEISEARSTRERALQAINVALARVQPQAPNLAMLDINSDHYDPDGYHRAKAFYEQDVADLQYLAAQQQDLAAQATAEDERAAAELFKSINDATKDAFIQAAPDITDPAKASAVFQGLMEYAISNGAPQSLFMSPTTAFEWHMLHKAREYDRLQAAKAKVKTDPKPEQRQPGPAIRPGTSTPPSARRAALRKNNLDRLATSGSIEAGAAVWKDILKG